MRIHTQELEEEKSLTLMADLYTSINGYDILPLSPKAR
jgi:hypothetical protein